MDKPTPTIQSNPQALGAIFLGSIAILTFFLHISIVGLIIVIFAARRLLLAKKNHEQKKLIIIAYIVTYLPVLLWLISTVLFVLTMLNQAKG